MIKNITIICLFKKALIEKLVKRQNLLIMKCDFFHLKDVTFFIWNI